MTATRRDGPPGGDRGQDPRRRTRRRPRAAAVGRRPAARARARRVERPLRRLRTEALRERPDRAPAPRRRTGDSHVQGRGSLRRRAPRSARSARPRSPTRRRPRRSSRVSGSSPRFRYDKRREEWTCEGCDRGPRHDADRALRRGRGRSSDDPPGRRAPRPRCFGVDSVLVCASSTRGAGRTSPSLPPDMVLVVCRSPMRAILLCAGRGVRFRPVTERIPKPLLPFLNVPLAVAHLRRLHEAGIREVAVNLHHLGDQIERQLREQSAELPAAPLFPGAADSRNGRGAAQRGRVPRAGRLPRRQLRRRDRARLRRAPCAAPRRRGAPRRFSSRKTGTRSTTRRFRPKGIASRPSASTAQAAALHGRLRPLAAAARPASRPGRRRSSPTCGSRFSTRGARSSASSSTMARTPISAARAISSARRSKRSSAEDPSRKEAASSTPAGASSPAGCPPGSTLPRASSAAARSAPARRSAVRRSGTASRWARARA